MKEEIRIGLQQRMLPAYRTGLFDALATAFDGRLGVFAGYPREDEAADTVADLQVAQRSEAHNLHFFDGKFYLCWQQGFLQWLKTWQPDVLIVEGNPRYLSTPRAVRWMHKNGRKVIAWGLGAPASSNSPLNSIRMQWQKRFFKQFDAILAYSQQGACEYQTLGIAPERIFVAPNAVAPRPIHCMPQRVPTFEYKKPILLFVGRLQARKRVDLLLQSIQDLPGNQKPELWIVGDGPVRNELENLAHETNSNARFLGALSGKALEEKFIQADLFVLPGTGGLAVQQAMSFGLPVIVAEADGTQSDLVRPQNGWIVPSGDFRALRNAITTALSDVAILRQMGEASYQIVTNEVNLENMVVQFKQAIYSVLEK